jgi:hypothetical protein
LPIRTLVAISHTVAALTHTGWASFPIAVRAVRDSLASPSSHHSRACVSSNKRMRHPSQALN